MSHYEIIVRGPKGKVCNEIAKGIEAVVSTLVNEVRLGWVTVDSPSFRLVLDHPATEGEQKSLDEANPSYLTSVLDRLTQMREGDEGGDHLVDQVISLTGAGERGYTEELAKIRAEMPDDAVRTESMTVTGPGDEKPVRYNPITEFAKVKEEQSEATSFEELSKAGGAVIEPPKEMPKPAGHLYPQISLLSPGSIGSEQHELLNSLLDYDLADVVIRPTNPPEFILTFNTKNAAHGAALSEIFSVGDLTMIHYVTNVNGDIISAQHLTDISLADIRSENDALVVVLYATARREQDSRDVAQIALDKKKQ